MGSNRIPMPNGAALLGRPNVLGTVTIAQLENGDVAITQSDFEPLAANLIIDKAKAALVQQVGINVKMNVPPPPGETK